MANEFVVKNGLISPNVQVSDSLSLSGKSITMGTAAPTTGTWVAGSRVFNSAPTAGGVKSWICVAAGTPGTWEAESASTVTVLSVKDFGAKGDGVTDDTTALNNALTFASTSDTKRVFIAGNCAVSSHITVPAGVEIYGGTITSKQSGGTRWIHLGSNSKVTDMYLKDMSINIPYDKTDIAIVGNTFEYDQANFTIDRAINLAAGFSTGPKRVVISRNKKITGAPTMFVYAETMFDCEITENYWDNGPVTLTGCTITPNSPATTATLTTTGSPALNPNSVTRIFLYDGTHIGVLTAKGGANSWTITADRVPTTITARTNVELRAYSEYTSGVNLLAGSRNNINNNTFIGGITGIIFMPNTNVSRVPITDNIISGNTIKDINEEGIGIDARGNANYGAVYLTTTVTNTISGGGNPVTLSIADARGSDAGEVVGSVVTFMSGRLRGRSFSIIASASTTSIQLGDDFPGTSYGYDVAIGDVITIELDIRRNKIINNNIYDCGTACISLWGSGSDTLIEGNTTRLSNISNLNGDARVAISVAGLDASPSVRTSTIMGGALGACNPHNVIISNNKHSGLWHIYSYVYGTFATKYKLRGPTIVGNRGGYCKLNYCTDVVENSNSWSDFKGVELGSNFGGFVDKDRISVKTFAAVGDGTTDDAVAIQAAADYVNNNGGGCVYFPKGTYLISTNILLGSNTQLLGESLSSVIKTTTTNVSSFMVRPRANTSNVTITNLTFDVNTHTAMNAVSAPSAGISNFTVEKCSFINASTNKDQAAYVSAYTITTGATPPTNIKVSGCTFTSNYSAVTGSIANGSTTLTLDTAVTGMIAGQGVRVMDLSGNVLVTTNIQTVNSTTSITLAAAAVRTDGLTTAQVAIGLTTAINTRGGANNIIIENNTINSFVAIRCNNYYDGSTTLGCTDVRIENNKITKANSRAILLEQATRATVIGNTITDTTCSSGTFGISVQLLSKDVIISNNTLDTSGEISCYLSSNVQIIGNRLKGSNCAGIEINDYDPLLGVSHAQAAQPLDTYNVVVTSNIISAATFSGIFCSATDVLIKGNIITDCLNNGIKIAEQGLRVSVTDNDIKNCATQTIATTTTAQVNSGSTSIPVASGTGIKNGDPITIFGAGSGGGNLTTTVSSGGGTLTLTIATATSTTINSGAAVYTYYGWFGGIRLGNAADSSPGIVDCSVENNIIVDSRTTKLHNTGISIVGPVSNVTLGNNQITGYVETSGINTTGVTSGATTIKTKTGGFVSDTYTGTGAVTVATSDVNANIVLAPGTTSGVVDVSGKKITSVGSPSVGTDAANKTYVDSVASGLDVKQSVRAATTASLTLTGGQLYGLYSPGIDGVAIAANDRVLVKDQTPASLNGIWLAKATGWQRATDADSSTNITGGMFTFVESGTINAGTGWVLTTAGTITPGTTSLTFSKFSSTTYTLPAATTSALGGVIVPAVATSGITNTSGTIGLATASTTQLGGVKVDGTTITISNGVITSVGGTPGNYTLPIASSTTLGGVKILSGSGLYMGGVNNDILLLEAPTWIGGGNANNTNLAIGPDACVNLEIANANYNLAIGLEALSGALAGDGNVAIGYQAANIDEVSSNTVSIGKWALGYNTTIDNSDSVSIGTMANYWGLGLGNIAIGSFALSSNTNYFTSNSNYNIAIGHHAMEGTPNGTELNAAGGDDNIAIGRYAYSYGDQTGFGNIMIGAETGWGMTSGARNVFIGYRAGQNVGAAGGLVILGGWDASSMPTNLTNPPSQHVIISDGTGTIKTVFNDYGAMGFGTTTVVDYGTAGYVLKSAGNAARPYWAAASTGGGSIATLTDVQLTGTPTNNQVLKYSTTSGKWVNGSGSADLTTVTGTLAIANGGTGATALTSGYVKGGASALTTAATIPTSDLTGTLAVANGGTGTTTGSITGASGNLTFAAAAGNNNVILNPSGTGTVDVSSKKISNLALPTADNDAVNKIYVDGITGGIKVQTYVTAATAANINTTTVATYNAVAGTFTAVTANTAITIDGQSTGLNVLNTRILVKDQNTTSQNGVYKCTTVAATGVNQVWTRDTDVNAVGNYYFVQTGTRNANTGWVLLTLATLTFTQYSAAGNTTTGIGLTRTGTQVSLTTTGSTSGQVLTSNGANVEPSWVTPPLSYGRVDVAGSTGSIGIGATSNVDITGYKSYMLYKAVISKPAWVRIYVDAISRTNDAGRNQNSDPTTSGVIAEFITTTDNQTVIVAPAVFGWNNELPVTTNIPIAITNNSGALQTSISVTLTVIKAEN